MRLVGLTGGIASGKSTVSAAFSRLGATIVDADVLAREVLAPGSEGLALAVAQFGVAIIGADGGLDRKRLGEIIFADAEQRKALEAITHPRIFQCFLDATEAGRARGLPAMIYDAPLLIERQLHLMMEVVVVVWVPREVQIERLMLRDTIDRPAAELRLAAQMPLDDKRALANHVIDNSGTREHTVEQVARVWAAINA